MLEEMKKGYEEFEALQDDAIKLAEESVSFEMVLMQMVDLMPLTIAHCDKPLLNMIRLWVGKKAKGHTLDYLKLKLLYKPTFDQIKEYKFLINEIQNRAGYR